MAVEIVIRPIEESDSWEKISAIYEKSWKNAYRGMLPDDFLNSIEKGKWAASLDTEERHSLIMLQEDEMIGTTSFCKSRFEDKEDAGEIVSIYLLPEYVSCGYGSQLLEGAIKELKKMNFHSVMLWVLEENLHARKFYERHGFVHSDEYLCDNIGGREVREMKYRKLL